MWTEGGDGPVLTTDVPSRSDLSGSAPSKRASARRMRLGLTAAALAAAIGIAGCGSGATGTTGTGATGAPTAGAAAATGGAFDAAHEGGTLHLLAQAAGGTLDPQVNYTLQYW